MPQVDIVLVEPIYEGNCGFTARVMKNFGFSSLVLVNACEIGDEGISRASHARDLLFGAEHCSLAEVFGRSDLVVATTGSVAKSVCHPMRMPYYTPHELRGRISDLRGRVSILFGRENWGLNNDEVERCDILCTIPASDEYPILNMSHAVGIICYELANLPRGTYPLATPFEMDHLYRHIDQYLDAIEHPFFKRPLTMVMIRRILGRAGLTTREASTLHGLLRRSENHLRRKE
jgi:tRNA/rRNA methyltransferase